MGQAISALGFMATLTAIDIKAPTITRVRMVILQAPLFPWRDKFIFKEKYLSLLLRSSKPVTGIIAVIQKATIPMLSNARKDGCK